MLPYLAHKGGGVASWGYHSDYQSFSNTLCYYYNMNTTFANRKEQERQNKDMDKFLSKYVKRLQVITSCHQ